MTCLYRITTPATARPSFCAGFVLNSPDGRVVECAPILRRHILGRWLYEVQSLCLRKGWTLSPVNKAAAQEKRADGS